MNIVLPLDALLLRMLLTSIPTESKFFSVSDLCGAFFSIPVAGASQYLWSSLGNENTAPGQQCLGGLLRAPSYFSQILKTDLGDIQFPRGFYFVEIYGRLASLLFTNPPQEDIIHLLKLLAFKGHKVAKEKLLFAQTQVHYGMPLIAEQGCPRSRKTSWCFKSPQTPKQAPTASFS